jgi:uncharacterized protein (DUF1499 family)
LVWRIVLLLLVGLPAAFIVAGQLGLFAGRAPPDLGVREGRFKPPSKTPNSVSSQADLFADHPQRDYARIAPLPGPMSRLRGVVQSMPGARIVEQRDDYLRVEFQTRVLKFTDDAEFWFDPAAGAIQVRSASRLGRGDLGVNRARIESIRRRLTSG